MNKIADFIRAAFYPNICALCFKNINAGELICPACKTLLPETVIKTRAVGGYPCTSPLSYKGQYAESVKFFKFHSAPQLAEGLAKLLHDYISCEEIDAITYVPMHKKRERERGYNQAKLLAEYLSKYTSIPCDDLLEKFKDNKEQHTLSGSERKKNVRGVYRAINQERIKEKRILLIDDIITTGNTLGECCRILGRAGADRVTCAAVCAKIG